MRTTAMLFLTAALAACGHHDKPEREPKSTGAGTAGTAGTAASGDPWSSGASGSGTGGFAGLGGDPMTMVKNIIENLAEPGPYEAPLESPGYDAKKPHLGVMTLSGRVGELASFSWTGGMSDTVPLRQLTQRLRALGDDAELTGLLLRLDDLTASLPDTTELRTALAAYKARGKKLFCHIEGAANSGYLVLTACDRIALAPTGAIQLSGPAAMPIHLKGLLDDVGVTADFLHVGAYKGAAEPLTRDRPSKEMEETIGAILDRAYATMVDLVATGRGLAPDQVKALIDEAVFPADRALAAKLVDEVTPFEAFRDSAAGDQGWTRIQLAPKADGLGGMMKIMRFVGAVPTARPTAPHVALVYAVGDVVDGDGGGSVGARQEIASRTLVAALRTLASDDSVKAVVLRIDSGGGSALASELIWHAVSALKAKKPVLISMSDVAASGGYYIACGATKIYALADTLTGSIGVVGGKLAPGAALARHGVTTFPMGRGKRATMNASLGPWNPDERATVQAMMESIYDVFVGRVAAGRSKKPEDIQPLAQGRVWTGEKAKELGLIDELGGLEVALADARKLGGVGDDVEVEVYPGELTLHDLVGRFGEVQLPFGLSTALAAVAHDLSPEAASSLEHTLRTLVRFRDARVQAVTFLPVLY